MVDNSPKWVDVKAVGDYSGTEYFGRFSLKPYLTHKERLDALRLADVYCRGISDPVARQLYTNTAFLKFHIIKTDATWWKDDGLDMYGDETPVYAICEQLKSLQKPKDAAGTEKTEETAKVPE